MARLLKPSDWQGKTIAEMLSVFCDEANAYRGIIHAGGIPGLDNRILENWVTNREIVIAELEASQITVRH
jgi:hypothetical protein